MSAGSQLLDRGWTALLDHHQTPFTWFPKGQPIALAKLLTGLTSRPADVATFGRNNLGVSLILFATADDATFAVDDGIAILGSAYRILEIRRQPADISVQLVLGATSVAGKQ